MVTCRLQISSDRSPISILFDKMDREIWALSKKTYYEASKLEINSFSPKSNATVRRSIPKILALIYFRKCYEKTGQISYSLW